MHYVPIYSSFNLSKEAHLIEMYKGTKIMNRKGEWGQNLPPKLVIEGPETQDKNWKWSRNPQQEPEANEVKVHESTQGNPLQQLKATQPPTKKQRKRQESTSNDPPKDKPKSSHLTVKQILAKMREIQSKTQLVQSSEEITDPSNTNRAELHTQGIVKERKNLRQIHQVEK